MLVVTDLFLFLWLDDNTLLNVIKSLSHFFFAAMHETMLDDRARAMRQEF